MGRRPQVDGEDGEANLGESDSAKSLLHAADISLEDFDGSLVGLHGPVRDLKENALVICIRAKGSCWSECVSNIIVNGSRIP